MDELRLSVDVLHADVAIITESWLKEEICDDLVYMTNFELFRCDRRLRRGGGVCIWVNSIFMPCSLSLSPIPSTVEMTLVRLHCVSFP